MKKKSKCMKCRKNENKNKITMGEPLLTNETKYFLDSVSPQQPLLNEPASATNSRLIKTMSEVAGFILFYYVPLITVVGTIGNILSILVFFRTRLKKLSSSYYLAALGVSDTGFLLVNFIQWLGFLNINWYNIDIMCQLFTYLSGVFAALSVWFVVAFTMERFIAVIYPLKRQTMCTVRRAKSVLLVLIFVSLIHCSPLLILSGPQFITQHDVVTCDVSPQYTVSITYLVRIKFLKFILYSPNILFLCTLDSLQPNSTQLTMKKKKKN